MESRPTFDIVFAFAPLDPKVDLAGEGLTRVIEQVVKAAVTAQRARFRIVTHDWCRPSVECAFAELISKSQGNVEIASIRSPIFFRIRSRYHRTGSSLTRCLNLFEQSSFLRPIQTVLLLIEIFSGMNLSKGFLGEASFSVQNLLAPLLLLLVTLATILLKPILRWMARASFEYGQRIEYWYEIQRSELHEKADLALVKAINRGPSRAVWVPTLNRACSELTKPWVFTFADWVPGTFPTLFVEHIEFDSRATAIDSLLEAATGVTTFSEWVKINQLPSTFNQRAAETHVIHHGPMDLTSLVGTEDRHQVALDVREQLQQMGLPQHISDWDWEWSKFIFAPTHLRPHKNFLTLFRAIEILNRKFYMNLRLVVTAATLEQQISGVLLGDWLRSRGLERQIVTVGRVSPELLAKMTSLASCVVSVSLFEASVPFMFSEATSTSTPVVLGANDVTNSEFINIPEARRLLANPHDCVDVAERIRESIQDSTNYLEFQRQAHDKYFGHADWSAQSMKYLQAFEDAALGPVGPNVSNGRGTFQ